MEHARWIRLLMKGQQSVFEELFLADYEQLIIRVYWISVDKSKQEN